MDAGTTPRVPSPPSSGAPPPRPADAAVRRWLERWGRLLLVGLALALILALWAARTAQVRRGLREYAEAHSAEFAAREFPGLSAADLVRLGTAHSPDQRPAGSYTLTPEARPPGTIRIGVFGCSFVRGAEVAQGADFPTRLGERLREAGHPAEVINFGVGGYGMHQAALLWQLAGRRYDLDHTIFHLYPFHEQRDSSFIQSALDFAPVHSRFVLRDGEAVRIDPLGDDRLEAAEIYLRFLTPWRYVRYDARGPAFLRALLPRGRELARNPFYYFPGDAAAEARELYPALFARLAAEGARGLIVTCNDEAACAHAAAIRERGVEVIETAASELARERPSLHLAPLDHLGALGNDAVAAELAARLAGEPRPRIPLLEIAPLGTYPPAGWQPERPPPERLRRGHRPELWIGGHRVAALLAGKPGGAVRRPFVPRTTAALLDVTAGQELVFLPLAEPLAGGEPITVRFRLDGRPVEAEIGRVEAAAPVLGRPRWHPGGAAGEGWTLPVPERGAFDLGRPLSLRSDRSLSDLEVRLAGRPLLRGEARPGQAGERRFRLRPAGAPAVHARADSDRPLDTGDLPPEGTIDLVIRFHNPKNDLPPWPRVPVTAYRRVTVEAPPPAVPLARPLPPLPAPPPGSGDPPAETRAAGAAPPPDAG